MADFPKDGKISFKWLESIIANDLEPFTGGGRSGDTNAIFGFMMYHLKHLGLLKEEKLEFDSDIPEINILQEKKAEAASFWE